MAVTVGPLHASEAEAFWEQNGQAFGSTRTFNPEALEPLADFVCLTDGDELVASGLGRPAGQWYGGQLVSCGAVAGVSVAPHRRGEALGEQLMTALLEKMHTDGLAISALFPTTALLYRKLGWEIAGDWQRHQLPLRLLAKREPGDVTARPGSDDDLATIRQLHSAMGPLSNGWLERTDAWWDRMPYRPPTGRAYFHLFERDGHPVGYLRMVATPAEVDVMNLRIVDYAATDAGAVEAIAGFLAGFDMVAGRVTADLPPHLMSMLTPQAQLLQVEDSHPWMLRLLDAAAAIAQRGWPLGLTAEVSLHITDAQLPHNDGPHVLSISGGVGSLEPGGAGDVRIGIGHLSAWYSGYVSAETLAFRGALTGASPQQLAALTLATAGDHPHLNEDF